MASQTNNRKDQNETGRNPPVEIEGAGGASDGSSGGGAGSGIPSGDLDARAGDVVERGDAKKDRKKLFPERQD